MRADQTGPVPVDPSRAAPPRRLLRGAQQLRELVGRRLLVGITYLDGAGLATGTQQFCGRVLEVADGVVVVERPDSAQPAVLPADAAAYQPAAAGGYRLSGTGEIVVDPDFVTTWRVGPQPS
jgi:hypothetical protein